MFEPAQPECAVAIYNLLILRLQCRRFHRLFLCRGQSVAQQGGMSTPNPGALGGKWRLSARLHHWNPEGSTACTTAPGWKGWIMCRVKLAALSRERRHKASNIAHSTIADFLQRIPLWAFFFPRKLCSKSQLEVLAIIRIIIVPKDNELHSTCRRTILNATTFLVLK